MNLYREEILELWQNPLNFGTIKKPDFSFEKMNKYCGDKMYVTGKIKKGILEDIKFQGETCAIARASASLFTERIKGQKIKEILKISQEDFLKEVNMELGASRINCSLLIYQTTMMALTSMSIKSDNIVV